MRRANIWLSACIALVLAATPVLAQDEEGFILELNVAETVNDGCQLTFVVNNRLGQPVEQSAFQTAMFDSDNRIAFFSVLQFGDVAAGRTKVVRFDIADKPCGTLSRILVNDVDQCLSDGAETDICFDRLVLRNLTEIAFE